jgi:hypothetical protein
MLRRGAARATAGIRHAAAMQTAAASSRSDAITAMAAVAAVAAAAAAALAWQPSPPALAEPAAAPQALTSIPWVAALAAADGATEVLTSTTLSSRAHRALGGDHLFSALADARLVHDVVAFYDAPGRRLHFVVSLGPDVCGWPGVVHGGLTAALVDEAMGHLFLALRAAGELPFAGPAFTASLAVEYRRRVPAPSTILVTAGVESACRSPRATSGCSRRACPRARRSCRRASRASTLPRRLAATSPPSKRSS